MNTQRSTTDAPRTRSRAVRETVRARPGMAAVGALVVAGVGIAVSALATAGPASHVTITMAAAGSPTSPAASSPASDQHAAFVLPTYWPSPPESTGAASPSARPDSVQPPTMPAAPATSAAPVRPTATGGSESTGSKGAKPGTYKGPVLTRSASVGANTYLDVNVGRTENGVGVDTATWDDYGYDDNQIWTVVIRSDQTAVLIPGNATGSYLTWLSASPDDVGGIWQQTGPSDSSSINGNQYWKLVPSDGGYELVTPSDGECLTAAWPGPNQFPGLTFLQACRAGNPAQAWTLPS
ncbi:MAG TPA: hypothetical protein VGX23_12250 [Actinocrinis sp.]|nr:hypothetical protein [Actinocrinis sp.]